MIDNSLPLVDLHRHLDGNIRPATIWDLGQKHQVALPANSLEALIPLAQIKDKTSDLLAFLQKLDYGVSVLADTDACYRIAYENMQDAQVDGLDYVELRFSPYYMARSHQLFMPAVIEAVINGVNDGSRDFGVKANLIGILSRSFGVDACLQELQALLTHKDNICALDLAGDELGFPAPLFTKHFDAGREAGWNITVHAGEADGPKSIWNAINLLGATRIGHGVKAIEDEKLMDYLAEHKVGIESCPTSNYQTATVANIADHPLKTFVEKGLVVTLNTDDPGVSDITLADEYEVAHKIIGLDRDTLSQIQLNGVNQAFLTDVEKQALIAKRAQ